MHISPIINKSSIQERGLIPTKVNNPAHLKSFKQDRQCTKDGKALYTWEDCNENEKFIKDMVFCKVWIEPRNNFYEGPNSHALDFRKFLDRNLSKYDHMKYNIYIAEVPDTDNIYVHIQGWTSDMTIENTCYRMPDEYAHNNKRLHIYKKPLKEIKIVGQVKFYWDNGKYHIRILR